MLLSDARKRLHQKLDDGVTCPCCGQFCKLYRRRLNSGMAAALIWLVRTYEKRRRWINVPKEAPRFVLRTKEYGTLKHWKLIEQKPSNDDSSKKSSGDWRPTKLGIAFVQLQCTVPSHVFLYNNDLQGRSDDMVDIIDALSDKFNYQELMEGTAPTGAVQQRLPV